MPLLVLREVQSSKFKVMSVNKYTFKLERHCIPSKADLNESKQRLVSNYRAIVIRKVHRQEGHIKKLEN